MVSPKGLISTLSYYLKGLNIMQTITPNETDITNLRNDLFVSQVILGEVSDQTMIDIGILLENDEFRSKLRSHVVKQTVLELAISDLCDFANNNF